MSHVCLLFHHQDADFAATIERALTASGHSVVRRDARGGAKAASDPRAKEAEAMVVLWSRSSVGSQSVIQEARQALARRILTSVCLGAVEPPASFQHLWSIDLSDWDGTLDDTRWRFVGDEVNLCVRRGEIGYDDGARSASAATPVKAGLARFAERPSRARGGAVLAGGVFLAAAAVVGGIGLAPYFSNGFSAPQRAGEARLVAADADNLSRLPGGARRAPAAMAPPPDIGVADEGVDAPVLRAPAATRLAREDDVQPELDQAAAGDAVQPAGGEDVVDQRSLEETPPVRAPTGVLYVAAVDQIEGPAQGGLRARDAPSLNASPSGDQPLADAALRIRKKPERLAALIAEVSTGTDQPSGGPVNPVEAADLPDAAPILDNAVLDTAILDTAGLDDEALDRAPAERASRTHLPVAEEGRGVYFRDCLECPDMAVLPGGSFLYGSPIYERARSDVERPASEAMIDYRFSMAAREVTYREWDACVADGGCQPDAARDPGWGKGDRPVVNVSWADAKDYAAWLSRKTGFKYRLPTEAEWEYAARAGAHAPFSFGDTVSTQLANFNGQYTYGAAKGVYRAKTLPVASFQPNAFGLFDMHGNVWEWTDDCWPGAEDGAACESRILKGGAWNTGGWRLRAGHRIAGAQLARDYDNGFRVVRAVQ